MLKVINGLKHLLQANQQRESGKEIPVEKMP